MTIPFDSSDDLPATLPEDLDQDAIGPDGALGPSVHTSGSGTVDSMARRLGAAPQAGLRPDPPSLGSGQAYPLDEERRSATLGDGAGSLDSEMEPADLDLLAEHALVHIGLAALTGGDAAPARALVGLVPDPAREDGQGGSGAEALYGPEDIESSEQTGYPATGNAPPGDPDSESLADSSDVPRSRQQDVPAPGTPLTGRVAPGGRGAAPRRGDPDTAPSAGSSDVPPSLEQDVPASGTPPSGRAAPGGRGAAPRQGGAPGQPEVPAPQGQGKSTRPASGRLTSEFGKRVNPFTGKPEFHRGQDIANPLGADVHALRDGTVIHVTQGHKHGDQHPNSVTIQYHTSKSEPMEYGIYDHVGSGLKAGDIVTQGQVVGQTDMSGPSTGPHLHYEHGIQQPGTADVDWIDPKDLLNAASPSPDPPE